MSSFSSGHAERRPAGVRRADPGRSGAPCWLMPFIDEDQPFGVEVELPVKPSQSPLCDVWTILFRGVRGLFYA